jgi:signal peptidase
MIQKLAVAVLLCFLIALAAPAGAPLQISYVTSDSMAPTLEANDGYVLVPAPTVETGDVITFYSEERDSYVTHRAIAVTPDGIVTKGDNNPTTDQASGYPPVQPSDVSGKLLTAGGGPVVIPGLGPALGAIAGYWYLIVGGLGAYLLVGAGGDRRPEKRDHVLKSREIVLPVTVLAIVAGIAFVSLGAVHVTQAYTVTDESTTDPAALTVGEARTQSITLETTTSPFTHVVTETAGMELVNTTAVPPGGDTAEPEAATRGLPYQPFESSQQTINTRIPPQDTAGSHETTVHVHPYPATLPGATIEALHRIHPLVAAIVTVLAGTAPLYLLYWLVVDTTTPLRPGRSRLSKRFGGSR